MSLCKECEQLGERSGSKKFLKSSTQLEKGEKCDRCGKTSYEEANEPEGHEHDWRPDGESWLKTVEACDCDYRKDALTLRHEDKCSKKQKRVRRYTCHCGASKTVDLKESGGKQ